MARDTRGRRLCDRLVSWRPMAEAKITPVPRLVGKAEYILDHIPQANEATFVNTIAELSVADERLGIAARTNLDRSELLGDLGAFRPLSRAFVRLHGTGFDKGVENFWRLGQLLIQDVQPDRLITRADVDPLAPPDGLDCGSV
jgi:hypothetical protein